MKSIRFRLMMAALAVLLGTMIARAQTADAAAPAAPPAQHTMHRHGFHRAGYMRGFFADYLNLSDAQRAQMKTIMQKERPTLKPLMQQLHQTRQQLRQFEEGSFDEAKVRAVATQQAQAQVELTVQQTRIHNELFQVLTTDQQAKMKEFEARRAARMQKRMGQPPVDAAPQEE